MKTIETKGIHPHDFSETCYKDVVNEIERQIVEFASNGDDDIKISVVSKGSGGSTVYQCIPKNKPVKSIDDFEFKPVGM